MPNQHGFDRWLARGKKCPARGSKNTVRDYFYKHEYSCSNCLMDGCTLGCDLLFWPLFLIYYFNPKRRAQTCLDCGHRWESW